MRLRQASAILIMKEDGLPSMLCILAGSVISLYTKSSVILHPLCRHCCPSQITELSEPDTCFLCLSPAKHMGKDSSREAELDGSSYPGFSSLATLKELPSRLVGIPQRQAVLKQ
jgi:hypothetical protein